MLRHPPVASVGLALGISKMLLKTLGGPKALPTPFTNPSINKSPLFRDVAMQLPSMRCKPLNGREPLGAR
jgi:hypothetical protein